MKRYYKIIALFAALLAFGFWGFKNITTPKGDPEKDKALLELLNYVLQKGHYSPSEINDDFSKKVFKAYIDNLDPTKRFFVAEDIEEFKKYEFALDDMFLHRDLSFFDLTYNRLMERMNQYKNTYPDILNEPFNFNTDETLDFDYEKMPFAANTTELKDRWKKQIKFSVLSNISDKMKLLQDTLSLEPIDTEDIAVKKKEPKEDYSKKSFTEVEKAARESVLKSMNEYWDFIDDLERKDWFTVYINSIVERFDPHTSYFAPDDKERFDVSISGKFEGIGARLQKKDTGVEISELISGGPAWRDRQLEAGDIILKVGQGNQEPIDIAGMRLDDVVKKIKGKKGTEVRLTVKKVDGTIKVIPIIRDEVELEETYAKSVTVEKNGKLYGIIYLPKFYISFDNKDKRDAFKDVAKEIERLKAQGIQGLIMDLRDNGGGSLQTVVDMTGLFIEKGPVVQVKYPGHQQEVLYDKDPAIQWDGPLVVMVNEFSASASEIFAAAIQDYKRGIVIGSKQTHGKGTVQNVVDLNQFIRNSSFGDMGGLKLTIQKFYRINGGSTQLEGVKSDIVLPDQFAYIEVGERDIDNAMPWDKVSPSDYQPLPLNFSKAIESSKYRLQNNPQFQLIDDNARWIQERKDDKSLSLNFEKYKAELETANARAKKYKVLSKYNNQLAFNSLPYEQELFKNDTILQQKRKRWHEDLTKDVYVEESLNVLNDVASQSRKVTLGKLKKSKTSQID